MKADIIKKVVWAIQRDVSMGETQELAMLLMNLKKDILEEYVEDFEDHMGHEIDLDSQP